MIKDQIQKLNQYLQKNEPKLSSESSSKLQIYTTFENKIEQLMTSNDSSSHFSNFAQGLTPN